MKTGWQLKKLGDLEIEYFKGVSPKEKPPDGDMVLIPSGAVFPSGIRFERTKRFASSGLNVGGKTLQSGDILLNCGGVGTLGRSAFFTGDAHIGSAVPDSFVLVIRSHNTVALNRFIFYFLQSEKANDAIIKNTRGTTGITSIRTESILGFEIPIPSVCEQKRIVRILDEAFDGIAAVKINAENNLQNARAVFESYLNNVFTNCSEGWVEKPLEAVTSIVNGFAFKSGDFSPSSETKCIKITNVGVREFVCNSADRLPSEFPSKYPSVAIPAGSIVIALTRTIISSGLKVAVVPADFDGALLNQRVAAILPRVGGVSLQFLYAYLSSQQVSNYVTGKVNTLMQPNLSIVDLRSMPVLFPSAARQAEITELLKSLADETQRLESIFQQKLTALDDLKKSLLHQAFSGAL